MVSSRPLVLLSLLAVAQATTPKIQWGPCKGGEFNTTLTVECGSLPVPLDYTNQNKSETLTLEIVKVAAAIQPSKGSILHNFGGPGLPARDQLVSLGPILQALSGGAYDLLGFDPRGTGTTIPFACVEDQFYLGQIIGGIMSGNDSENALARVWARSKADNNICLQIGPANKTAEYISTAFTARDFISVVDALGEDGLLRYWGFSYGTTLGATLAAMFPERIDKLIIDGVQNPHEYYYAASDFEEWADTDAVFSYFFTSCIEAGPANCPFAALNLTAAQLEADAWAFFDEIRANPIVAGPFILDFGGVKGIVHEALKNPPGWNATAQLLAVLMYGTEEEKNLVAEAFTVPGGLANPAMLASAQRLLGIHCGERTVRYDSLTEAAPAFELLTNTSRLTGDVMQWTTAHCLQWPYKAKEIYMGDFTAQTRNPILVVSNRRDAHTPLRSARNVSEGFDGSGFLEVDGTGHCSVAAPSVCTFYATVAYWLNGTLPEEGLVCDSPNPWVPYTWADVLEEVTGVQETSIEKREAYSRTLH